jgi:hypothetical protein
MEKNMNKKQILMTLCVVALTTSVLAFDKPTQIAKRIFGFVSQAQTTQTQNANTSENKSTKVRIARDEQSQKEMEVPENVLYDQMFRLIVEFKKKAEEQATKGEQITPLRDYFQREAQLSDEQTRILQDVAKKFVDEVSLIDAQAKVIIENIRAGVPRGQPITDKKILEPPVELRELQKKREELALQYRDHLRDLFGTEQFEKFQKFVQEKMSSVITVVPVSSDSLRPADESRGTERRIEK